MAGEFLNRLRRRPRIARCDQNMCRLCRKRNRRHSTAMERLSHGVDRSVIALWLGHESVETTQMYLHADLRLKEQALSRTTPHQVTVSRYKPSDQLLAFLEGL